MAVKALDLALVLRGPPHRHAFCQQARQLSPEELQSKALLNQHIASAHSKMQCHYIFILFCDIASQEKRKHEHLHHS